jgi:hypothetical protein
MCSSLVVLSHDSTSCPCCSAWSAGCCAVTPFPVCIRSGAKKFFVGTCTALRCSDSKLELASDVAAFFLLSWPKELRRFHLFCCVNSDTSLQVAGPSAHLLLSGTIRSGDHGGEIMSLNREMSRPGKIYHTISMEILAVWYMSPSFWNRMF